MSEIITIRKASKSDVSSIAEIANDCKLAFWSESDYLSEIENENSFIKVAHAGGKIAGFILARFNFAEFDENSGAELVSEADLLNIGVLNSFQKQGIGSKLLDTLIFECRNRQTERIWLEVRESNSNARKFYKRKGFVETQIRRNFYTHPTENAVLMLLDIKKYIKNENIKT